MLLFLGLEEGVSSLIGGVVCGLLWSGGALVVRGLDSVKFMLSAGSLWLDIGEAFSLLSMMVFLSLQVTDFTVSDGVVVSSFSTVYKSYAGLMVLVM